MVPDRRRNNRIHPSPSVLALSVCAMLCGARGLYAVFSGGAKMRTGARFLWGFRKARTPCHAGLHHVFGSLDAADFESVQGA